MASLVICEKPSVAKDIAKALNVGKKLNGYYEGNKYIVTWAMGHLVTLAAPERYDQKFKHWDMKDLPIIPTKNLKYDILPKTKHQYNTINRLINNNKVKDIIIATDAGREGELVARLILLKAGNKKPLKRLWISSVTKKAIIDGFNKLQPGNKYEGLFMSALARSYADWVVGINASRALTTKYNASLNCGRVQTPTLQLVYDREQKVKKFVPKPYYNLICNSSDIKFKFETTKQFNKEYIEEVHNKLKDIKTIEITDIKEKDVKEYPDALYDLTRLQIDASNKYNFSPKMTLDLVQSLYEFHKVLTYPRTDSRYLTSDMKNTIEERIKASNIYDFNLGITKNDITSNKCFNDSKVSDHHAIIPTETNAKSCSFTEAESKIYKLVVTRFFQVFMKPSISKKITLHAKINEYPFTSNTTKVVTPGFKEIEGATENYSSNLSKNGKLQIDSIAITEEYTTAPKYLTEATLIDAMENLDKYIDLDKKDKDILKEAKGIGTVATRADIIEKLFNSYLIEKVGNGIKTTNKAVQLLEIVPSDLKSPIMTADLEKKLVDISDNKLKFDNFRTGIDIYTKNLISEIKSEEKEFVHDNITNTTCPKCESNMLKVKNKSGDEVLTCSNVECKHRIRTKSLTKVQCPECRKKLYKIYSQSGDSLVCMRCGFKKKERDFFDRPNKNAASKSDIKKYTQKKQEHDASESPFAKLLDMFDE